MIAKRNLIPIFVALLLWGCVGDKAEDVHSVWPGVRDIEQKVFFVTDREKGGPWGGFGKHWANALSCGSVTAEIPPLGLAGERSGHFQDKSPLAMECGEGTGGLAARIAAEAHALNCGEVLIYVHGFNTLFDGAVLRAAQLALDTRWGCPVAAFSWSSEGVRGRYVADIEHSAYAVPELEAFLRALDAQGLRVDVLGHSIGTRLVLSALASMAAHDNPPREGFMREMILAAADVGAEPENNDFAHLLASAAPFVHRTTVYASRGDAVLAVSTVAHGDVPRAGRRTRGDRELETQGERILDVVDCTDAPAELLGHSYFGLSLEAVSDIALVLRGTPVEQRLSPSGGWPATLVRAPDPGPPHYVLDVVPGRRPDVWVRLIRHLAPLVPRIELAPLTGSPE